jgi:hypothetical protein
LSNWVEPGRDLTESPEKKKISSEAHCLVSPRKEVFLGNVLFA